MGKCHCRTWLHHPGCGLVTAAHLVRWGGQWVVATLTAMSDPKALNTALFHPLFPCYGHVAQLMRHQMAMA